MAEFRKDFASCAAGPSGGGVVSVPRAVAVHWLNPKAWR